MLKHHWVWGFVLTGVVAIVPALAGTNFKFNIKAPEGWQAQKDLVGVEYTLMGPMKDGSRPLVMITDSDAKVGVDASGLKSTEARYQADREEWVKGRMGEVIKFIPYQQEKWPSVSEVHSIGFKYRLLETAYTEKSYFVVCKDRLFYIKSLMRADEESTYSSKIDEALRTFTCG